MNKALRVLSLEGKNLVKTSKIWARLTQKVITALKGAVLNKADE